MEAMEHANNTDKFSGINDDGNRSEDEYI